MAPEQSTQTNDAYRSYYSPEAAYSQPPNVAGKGPAQPYAMYPNAYGQPFQPYHQAAVSAPLVPNKAWEMTKLVLHGLSIIFAICALGTSLSLLSRRTGPLFVAGSTPVAAACIIWSLAEIITRWVRKFQSGIHPGAHVALSLLIWLSAAFVAGIEGAWLAIVRDDDDDYSIRRCYDSRTDSYYDCSDERDSGYEGGGAVARAACAFTALLWLVHFILFVGACIDTAKRNAANKRAVMVIPAPVYWGGPPQNGWQPVPQQDHPETAAAAAANIPLQHRSSPAPPADGQASPWGPGSAHDAAGNQVSALSTPPPPPAAFQNERVPTVMEHYAPSGPRP